MAGIVTQAREVHHIDDDHTNNLESNLMALCKSHHSRRTNATGNRAAAYQSACTNGEGA